MLQIFLTQQKCPQKLDSCSAWGHWQLSPVNYANFFLSSRLQVPSNGSHVPRSSSPERLYQQWSAVIHRVCLLRFILNYALHIAFTSYFREIYAGPWLWKSLGRLPNPKYGHESVMPQHVFYKYQGVTHTSCNKRTIHLSWCSAV